MNAHDSMLFDVYKWEETPELKKLFDEILSRMPSRRRKNKTISGIKNCIRLFLSNMIVSNYYDKSIAIGLRDTEFSTGRYKLLHIKRYSFKEVYKAFVEQNLIEVKKGFRAVSERKYEKGCVTRIWPKEEFRQRLNAITKLPEKAAGECLILRSEKSETGKKGEDIPIAENEFSTGIRIELEKKINSVFLNHSFSFSPVTFNTLDTCESYLYDNLPCYSTLTDAYERYFNETDDINETVTSTPLLEPNRKKYVFKPRIKGIYNYYGKFAVKEIACGRLYADCLIGPSWQNMPSQDRKTILIDDAPVVELDYCSFHICIAYALMGIQLTVDPYSLVAPKEMRPIIKVLFLTAINTKTDGETVNSMNTQILKLERKHSLKEREIKFLDACYKYECDWRTLIKDLKEAHKQIASFFCSGAGMKLQTADSAIMRSVLLELAEKDIPCLPVHDSAIVAAQHEKTLAQAMDNAYKKIIGNKFYCHVEKK